MSNWYVNGKVFTRTTAWEPKNEFDFYFDLCWRAEIIQVGLNMHLYVDIVGWSLQVEALLKLSGATDEVKLASVLGAIPANILTKAFVEKSSLCLPNDYNYLSILEKVRVFFAQNPDVEKDCYDSPRASTKKIYVPPTANSYANSRWIN